MVTFNLFLYTLLTKKDNNKRNSLPYVFKDHRIEKAKSATLFLVQDLGYSMKNAQRAIDRRRLFVNGEKITQKNAIVLGDVRLLEFVPNECENHVVFETKEFALFDKPSGMSVHPTGVRDETTLIDCVKSRYGMEANIVHRLDRETSGLVLVTKRKRDEADLKRLFEERRVKKVYLAYVSGKLVDPLSINAPISKNDTETLRSKVLIDMHNGKPALTDLLPLEYIPTRDISLVRLSPHTGRQHQLRVHMFHVEHPIVGEPLYGQTDHFAGTYLDKQLSMQERIDQTGASRVMLHAQELVFDYKGRHYHIVSKQHFDLSGGL
jgi:23S rRNA pseudouridine1911/1915/1917 synthase